MEKKTKLTESDIWYIMNTIMLEVHINEDIPLDDLYIVRNKAKGVSYIARRRTRRGIVRKFDSEL